VIKNLLETGDKEFHRFIFPSFEESCVIQAQCRGRSRDDANLNCADAKRKRLTRH